MTENYQLDYPNSHYLLNLNTLNEANRTVDLNRLPTLGEILSNKTKSPVDLYTFYLFMKEVEGKVDYLDFWFDLINHLNLCKHYVKGLRESILRQSSHMDASNRNSNFSNLHDNRESVPFLEKSKHRSLSSSILLDLIINDHVLEDNDSNRLSAFLRGDINVDHADPKLKAVIDQYREEKDREQRDLTPLAYKFEVPRTFDEPKRVLSGSRLLDDSHLNISSIHEVSEAKPASFITLPKYVSLSLAPEDFQPPKRPSRHSINPSLLEKLIKENSSTSENHSFITRNNLKESSHNILLKYFVEDSEKNLYLPHDLNQQIIRAIEYDGRDDPDVFANVKVYVFNKIENDHLPRFLNFMAIRNIHKTINIRIIVGFVALFIAFWIGFCLIFLDYFKGYRAPVVIPFLVGFYCLVSSIYLIDPLLCWFRLSESFVYDKSFIRISEPFIYRLLLKRSLWVLFLILVLTAAFTVLFCLVPGHRL